MMNLVGMLIAPVPVMFAIFGASILWIYALVSAVQHERLDPSRRLVWVLAILFIPFLGLLFYLWLAPDRPRQKVKKQKG